VKVLAVDDDPAALDLHASALEPEGFTVLRAAGGREGLRLARSEKPDLVLLDLLMPDVDGFTVVSQLREDQETREIPVLVVTGHKLSEEEKERLNGSVAGVLSKGDEGLHELGQWLTRVGAGRG
jgi:CheY-like chemotaxis protein